MKPPFIARTLLRFLPARHREFIVGDLEVEYQPRLLRDGRWSAGFWYWRQAIASLASEARAGVRHESIVELGEPKRGSMFDALRQDLRYTWRSLNGRPLFTTVAVITLALGIGANTGIYSVANWLALRPVPGVVKPEELAIIDFGKPTSPVGISWANLDDLQRMTTSLQGMAGTAGGTLHVLAEGKAPREVRMQAVGRDYFGLLGLRMQRGRPIHADETVPGKQAAVAVISDRLWTELFARDRNVIGRTLRANKQVLTVVGVAPKNFQGSERLGGIDVWVPFSMQAALQHRDPSLFYERGTGFRFFEVIGRLKPGVTADAARADLDRALEQLVKQYPKENDNYADRDVQVYAGIGERILSRESTAEMTRLMLGIVALLLIISSANVANMLLVRAAQKRSELAMRRALGASIWRLASQQLVESLALAMLGGLAGLLVATTFLRLIEGGRIFQYQVIESIPIDVRVLLFTLGVCVLTGLLFALTPLGVLWRLDVINQAQGTSNRHTGKPSFLRNGIVVTQIALSLVLVVGALLLGRTVNSLLNINVGFDPNGLGGIAISTTPQGYKREETPEIGRRVLEQVRQSPLVESAALSYVLPFSGMQAGWRVKDPLQRSDKPVSMSVYYVSDGFFETMRIPIVRGRGIEPRDWTAPNPAAFNIVLSETGSRRLFDGRDPIGQTVTTEAMKGPVTLRVVGVARDAQLLGLAGNPGVVMYWPVSTLEYPFLAVTARSRGASGALEPELLRALAAVDPAIPTRFVNVTDSMRAVVASQRLLALMLTLFSIVAVVLAGIGLYGVLGSSVAARRREFGLRMALGAETRRIIQLVAAQSAWLVVMGLTLGLVAAYWLSKYIESQLYGVNRLAPSIYIAAGATFALVAAIATAVPTRAAVKVEPFSALRQE